MQDEATGAAGVPRSAAAALVHHQQVVDSCVTHLSTWISLLKVVGHEETLQGKGIRTDGKLTICSLAWHSCSNPRVASKKEVLLEQCWLIYLRSDSSVLPPKQNAVAEGASNKDIRAVFSSSFLGISPGQTSRDHPSTFAPADFCLPQGWQFQT